MGLLRWLSQNVLRAFGSGTKLCRGLSQDQAETEVSDDLTRFKQCEAERREKDEVAELVTRNGFHNCCHGRSGYIYYAEDGHLCETYYEASGNEKSDIVLWPGFKRWVMPEDIEIPQDKRLEILHRLRPWLQDQKLKAGIDLPANIEFEDKPCIWGNCDERKIKGSVYCLRHYDLNLLGE